MNGNSIDIPHTRLPISNIADEETKTGFSGKYLYNLPQVDWNAATVRKKADPYQPT